MRNTERADFTRNLGLLTQKQQQQLFDARVAVAGVGGMGGVAAEALVRMGVGTISIADGDRYAQSDVNRQLHSTTQTVDRLKVDVVGERLCEINPQLRLTRFGAIDESNVEGFVADCDILLNGMDCLRSSILLERTARRLNKTIVDAWITPYASVFVTTPQAPHWEEFLGFPTAGKSLDAITEADLKQCLLCEIRFTLSHFHPERIVAAELVNEVIAGIRPRPSLVPVVWLSGTLMANEAMKILTGQGRIASCWGVFYNQYDHELKVISEEQDGLRHAGHVEL